MRLRNLAIAAAALGAAFFVSPASDATTVISPSPKLRFEDGNGNPLSGGKLFTYQAGTTTKQTTYTDQTGGTPNANPIILDSRGEANVWLTPGQAYKFVLSPSTDTDPPTNPIYTVDQLSGNGSVASITCNNQVTCTPSSITGNGTVGLSPIATGSVLCNVSGSTATPVPCSISTLVGRNPSGGNVTYYLSASGNDANDCLTVPTACRTPSHIQSLIGGLDLSSGNTVTVNLADGNYAGWEASIAPPGCSSAACVTWIGNTTTPANVTVSGSDAIMADKSGVAFTIKGMTLQGNGAAVSGLGYGLYVVSGAQVLFDKIVFAACNNAHIFAQSGGTVAMASGSATYSITGNAPVHLNSQNSAMINIGGATVTLTGTPAFSTAFAVASATSSILAPSVSFSGTATGQRYQVSLNGVINTGTAAGNTDNSYFPGNSAGTSSSGGYYN